MGSFYDYFKSFDEFGSSMALNYKGSTNFHTCLGAFCSLFLEIFIMIFGFFSFLDVWAY